MEGAEVTHATFSSPVTAQHPGYLPLYSVSVLTLFQTSISKHHHRKPDSGRRMSVLNSRQTNFVPLPLSLKRSAFHLSSRPFCFLFRGVNRRAPQRWYFALPSSATEGGGRGRQFGPHLWLVLIMQTSGNHVSALRHTNRMIYRPGLCVFLNLILIYLK